MNELQTKNLFNANIYHDSSPKHTKDNQQGINLPAFWKEQDMAIACVLDFESELWVSNIT